MKIISPFLQVTQYPIPSSFPKNNLTWKIMCYQSLYFLNPKLFKDCFKSTNRKHRLNTEWRRTGAGSYPVIFPLFGLLSAQREDLPACGCPSKRGLEIHLQTWPLRNQQMLQRGVLCGHPNWSVGSGMALGFLSAKQSISLLVYWNQSVGGKTKPKRRRKESNSSNSGMLEVTCVYYLGKVSLDILLQFLWLYIHIANFVANKALRICADSNAILLVHIHTHTCSNFIKSAKKNPLKSSTVMEL